MLKTSVCDLFGITYPIIQGGMAHLATAELVSAVSNAGGLGILAAADYDRDWLQQQIRETRRLTGRPFGVNLYLQSQYVEQQIQAVIEEEVPVVATGAGDPGLYIPRLKRAGVKVISVTASVRQAERLAKAGVDAIVAEGMEAGGHIGEVTTLVLLPRVIDAVSIPVLAAGGIADGRGLAAALSLGAQGIQMGTRFICSEECRAHPNFKARILQSGEDDTVVIGRSTGHPVRCLKNGYSRDYLEMEKAGASPEELEAVGRGRLYLGVIEGDIEEGLLMAGQASSLIRDIRPVKAIIQDIIEESQKITGELSK